MEVISDKKGEKSIQITSLLHILNDSRFQSPHKFFECFDDAEVFLEKRKRKLSPEFKIFTIMDTDDCTDKQKREYIDKTMFKTHWAYDFIVPIYNIPTLEDVLVKAKILFQKRGDERKKNILNFS